MSKIQKNENTTLENVGRRKAVKKIVGVVTAVAAYNFLPAKWSKPIVESVFLPAHAATSGFSGTFYDANALGGQWGRVSLTVNLNGTAIFVRINRNVSRRWEASFSSIPGTGTITETATSSDPTCTSLSNPPGAGGGPSSTISLVSVDATQAELYVGGGGGAEFPLIIPAGSIPAEPALTGSCASP